MDLSLSLQLLLIWISVSLTSLPARAWRHAEDFAAICPPERTEHDLNLMCLSENSLLQCNCYFSEATDHNFHPPYDFLPPGLVRVGCKIPEGLRDDEQIVESMRLPILLCGENCYCVDVVKQKYVEGVHPPVWSKRYGQFTSESDAKALIDAQIQGFKDQKAEEERAAQAAAEAAAPDIDLPWSGGPPAPDSGGGSGAGGSGGSGKKFVRGGLKKFKKIFRPRKGSSGKGGGQSGCNSQCASMEKCSVLSTRGTCADDLICVALQPDPVFPFSFGRCLSRDFWSRTVGQLGTGSLQLLGGRSVDEAEDEDIQPATILSNQLPLGELACLCNATYISRQCCDATKGMVWESEGSSLLTGGGRGGVDSLDR
jgi:hypothetical protein